MRTISILPLIALSACNAAPAPPEATAAANTIEDKAPAKPSLSPAVLAAAEKDIRAEPKVRDLLYEPHAPVQWKIAVADDGSDRLGLAGYFCLRLGQMNARLPGTRVRLVSWQRVTQNRMYDDDADLGTMDCDSNQRFGSGRS